MPAGQIIPANLGWTVAKKILSPQDIERLACAFLNSTGPVNYDAVKAGKEIGNVKPRNFKDSIWAITKKIKDHKGDDGDEDDEVATPAAKGKNGDSRGGQKRKTSDDEETAVTKKRRGSKKARAEAESEDDGAAADGIKTEVAEEKGDESESELM